MCQKQITKMAEPKAGNDSLVMRVPKAPERDSSAIALAALAVIGSGVAVRLALQEKFRQAVMRVVSGNQMLQAVLAPALLAGTAGAFGLLLQFLYKRLVSGFYCSVSVSNKDKNFNAVLDYISSLGVIETSTMIATTYRKKNMTWKDYRSQYGMGVRDPPKMEFRPSNESSSAMSMFLYKDKKLFLRHVKGETVTTGWNRVPTTMETLHLSTFGRDNTILIDLFDSALRASFKEETDVMNIYVLSNGEYGVLCSSVPIHTTPIPHRTGWCCIVLYCAYCAVCCTHPV
jgi:hypothetical protein